MAFDEPEIRVLFPVPLVTVRIQGADELNARLLDEIAQRQTKEPGIDRSNRYGWHSALDFFDRTEPAHAELAAEIEAIVEAATAKLAPEKPAELEIAHEGWINVSPTHAMNAPHDHPGAFWSGTYYARVPETEPDDRLSGAIEFLDPRGSLGSSGRVETSFTRSKFTARPTAGTCFLWPGFLRHWVHPNRASEERVSIAFNSRFLRTSS